MKNTIPRDLKDFRHFMFKRSLLLHSLTSENYLNQVKIGKTCDWLIQDEQKHDINESKHDNNNGSAGCIDSIAAIAANLQSDDEIDIQLAAHAEATPTTTDVTTSECFITAVERGHVVSQALSHQMGFIDSHSDVDESEASLNHEFGDYGLIIDEEKDIDQLDEKFELCDTVIRLSDVSSIVEKYFKHQFANSLAVLKQYVPAVTKSIYQFMKESDPKWFPFGSKMNLHYACQLCAGSKKVKQLTTDLQIIHETFANSSNLKQIARNGTEIDC